MKKYKLYEGRIGRHSTTIAASSLRAARDYLRNEWVGAKMGTLKTTLIGLVDCDDNGCIINGTKFIIPVCK